MRSGLACETKQSEQSLREMMYWALAAGHACLWHAPPPRPSMMVQRRRTLAGNVSPQCVVLGHLLGGKQRALADVRGQVQRAQLPLQVGDFGGQLPHFVHIGVLFTKEVIEFIFAG